MRQYLKTAKYARRIKRSIEGYYATTGVKMPAFRVVHSDEVCTPAEMQLVRENGTISALLDLRKYKATSFGMMDRTAAFVHWFEQAPSVRRISCDISDGLNAPMAEFSYSTCWSHVTPLPDMYFFRDRGYFDSDKIALKAPDWVDRTDDIIWRGGPNNIGLLSTDPAHIDNAGVMQRVRMAMKCLVIDDIDFRFVQYHDTTAAYELKSRGLLGDFVAQDSWAGRKYAIDIDGFTCAWDNFLRRLKMGCCVFKVDSQFGFRQWYYDRLKPFEHYIPIRADLSDLEEQVAWARTHQTQARDIAMAGQDVARDITFKSEAKVAGDLITRFSCSERT